MSSRLNILAYMAEKFLLIELLRSAVLLGGKHIVALSKLPVGWASDPHVEIMVKKVANSRSVVDIEDDINKYDSDDPLMLWPKAELDEVVQLNSDLGRLLKKEIRDVMNI